MELIVLSNKRCKTKKISLGPYGLIVGSIVFSIVIGIAFSVGAHFATQHYTGTIAGIYEQAEIVRQQEVEQQKFLINEARNKAKSNLDALATRLSKLQGHIMRLDALGSRLAVMADLDDIKFDALEPPGMGGPVPSKLQSSLQVSDFVAELERLSLEIKDRGEKLAAMESMLIDNALQAQTLPGGRPVPSGWISSLFGWRADPIIGKREFHEGIDFAGKSGSQVFAVAAGIVTWSGKRYGYGDMVEVNHGNGYVTRYAHNKRNLVTVGQKVNKGQTIAIMGSTGRSTGPHVHFEVVYNGKPVNPKKYLSVN
ncbi:MAG: M23 family metallopeptidase [Gammaproteobacteria bacterium]